MLKVKVPKIALMILTSVFCLYLTGLTVADECWNGEGGGPTFTGNHNYPSGWFPEFQYDPNNPDEIDRNNSVEISVIEGFPPYMWEVSGTGFNIPSSTTDRTNTLSADNTACGAAKITVTDKYGDSCTGYVRCTEGKWVLYCSPYCVLVLGTPCSCPADPLPDPAEYIEGEEKWVVRYSTNYCKSAEGGAHWGDHYKPWNPCNCPDPPCGNPWGCRKGNGPCYFAGTWMYYYKWECK